VLSLSCSGRGCHSDLGRDACPITILVLVLILVFVSVLVAVAIPIFVSILVAVLIPIFVLVLPGPYRGPIFTAVRSQLLSRSVSRSPRGRLWFCQRLRSRFPVPDEVEELSDGRAIAAISAAIAVRATGGFVRNYCRLRSSLTVPVAHHHRAGYGSNCRRCCLCPAAIAIAARLLLSLLRLGLATARRFARCAGSKAYSVDWLTWWLGWTGISLGVSMFGCDLPARSRL